MTEREPAPDPIHAFLDSLVDEGQRLDESAQHSSTDPSPTLLSCCCGNQACAYLTHNQTTLNALARDVCEAGKLGQVCILPVLGKKMHNR
jgi:hypothetical protein